jgi:ABC-type transport system substrate-binding protein
MPSTSASRFYVINARSTALANVDDRRGLLAAVDTSALALNGSLVAADGLAGQGLAGWRPTGGCGQTCRPDQEAAAAVAARIGSSQVQEPLTISYSGADQAALAQAVSAQLADAGFVADHQMLSPNRLAEVIVTGETDLFSFGWIAPGPSIDAVIPPLLTVDSPLNIARAQSAEVADLLATAAVTADDDTRWELLSQAERLALADALIIPLANSISSLDVADDAGGLVVRSDGSLDLESGK